MSTFATLLARAENAVEDGDRAPSQAGVIEGANPTEYSPKDPIILFIVQVILNLASVVPTYSHSS